MAAKMMIVADTVTPTAWAIELRAGRGPSLAVPVSIDGQRGLADAERRRG